MSLSHKKNLMENTKRKSISVVIPCYNEEGNITELHERISHVLAQEDLNYEIIFVDNCSTDNSDKLLRNLASVDEHVVVVFFSRNFGNSQYGYTAGMDIARGDAVIWMEGDLQDPPELISKLIQKWREGYQVVYGLRPKAVGSWFSRFSRTTFYRIFSRVSYLDIPRDAGDFSLLDRVVVDVLNSFPERSRFVRGLRAWAGFRHTGVIYERSLRKSGKTSNPSFWSNVWWAKKFIFSFSDAPLELVSKLFYMFVIVAVIGTLAASYGMIVAAVSIFTGFVSIFVLWVIASIMLVSAIIAETLSIIFEEVKQRPKYIIREILSKPFHD